MNGKEIVLSNISLRDYFAAKAMAEIVVEWQFDRMDEMSKYSYAIADSMLKAREEV